MTTNKSYSELKKKTKVREEKLDKKEFDITMKKPRTKKVVSLYNVVKEI